MSKIQNIGPVSQRWLDEIGVHNVEELRQICSLVAYKKIAQQQKNVSLNLLWSLEAAVQECDWRDLPEKQ